MQNQHGKTKTNCIEECKNLTKYQTRYFVKTLFLSFIHGVFIMLYIQSYSFISLLIPSGSNVVSRPQVPRSRHFSRFYIIFLLNSSHDSWENEALLVKIGARVIQNLWLDMSSAWVQSDPNLVSRPQAPSSRHFLRLCDFIGFISLFLKKWGPVSQYWS